MVSSTTDHATGPAAERSLQLAIAAARTAMDNRGRDVAVLDLRELTPVFDYFVLVTGTSGRQLRAMSEDIDNVLEKELGDKRMGIEGFQDSRWILLDYGSVVVHLFDAETRRYYDLEHLWSGAKPVDLQPFGIATESSLAPGTGEPGRVGDGSEAVS
ncbi:MAG: ribosome silencing factor [Pirellulaceae bacterium]